MRAPAAPGDTIAALSSGRPPAGIAVIRVSGPSAHAAAVALAGALPPPRTASLRLLVDPRDKRPLDRALALRFDAPASATGEDLVELHCHGGRAVVDAVLGALLAKPGVRIAEPGEFTRRALANGRIDLTEAEGLADLLAAETEGQRRAALALAEGALARRLDQWRERLLALSAQAEVAIDYADEEDGAAADAAIRAGADQLAEDIQALLDAPRIEPLREGLRVAIAGPPNSGKSSLINAIFGSERAIVTPIAGTTRDSIEVPLAIGGLPFVLVDTAGLRDSNDPVETIGIARARREAERAQLLLWLGNPADAPAHPGLIRIHPKADLGADPPHGSLPLSAHSGQGIDTLLALLVERGRALLPADDALALNRRQAESLDTAVAALREAVGQHNPLLVAEQIRFACASIDCVTGRAGVEAMLDALFARFCLGK